jgi:hypothetical protein
MDNSAQEPHTDFPESTRLRVGLNRWKWATGISVAAFVVSGVAGSIADLFSLGDITGFAAVALVVSGLFASVCLIGRRRMQRLLDLQLRRELAAAQRSSEAKLTATALELHPTPAPESAETARLKTAPGYAPVGIPLLVAWGLTYFLWANEALLPWSAGGFIATSVGVLILIVVVLTDSRLARARSALAASEAADAEAHLQALKVEAARTPAAPVLYLRSFTDDGRAARRHGVLTEEEQLAKALAWMGPLLAVGRPGETLPHVGAQRIYLKDEEWQQRVAQLMAQARLVVLRTGSTAGFHWEVEHALSALTPERLLLVADDRCELQAVLRVIARHAGRSDMKLWLPFSSIASVKGLVMFGPGWTPRALRLPRAFLRSSGLGEPLVGRFTLALRPLFERHEVAFTPPGPSTAAVVVSIMIAFPVVGAAIGELIEWLIAWF